jgi:glycosyltransferase involved in cell wall biosynthesis
LNLEDDGKFALMDNNKVKLSVCLLVYNHDHILEETIDSILNQTYNDFEFIISDDNSTDTSWDIIREYASKFNKIKAIKTPSNLGMAGNANYAISQSKGNTIALLHHDDILDCTLLEKWIKVFNKSNKIAFVFNDYDLGNNIIYHRKMNYHFNEIMDGKIFLKKYLLKYGGSPVRGTTLIRKSFFEEIGGMDIRFGLLADVDLWMRLAAIWDVGYVNEPLIKVGVERKGNYPKDYTEFTWERIFIGFNIHANNINRKNYKNIFSYLWKRFVFRNNASVEIIKWHIYALIRNKYLIIKNFPFNSNNHEYFYSKLVRYVIFKSINK